MIDTLIIVTAQYAIALVPVGIVAVFLLLNVPERKRFLLHLVIGGLLGVLLLKLASTLYYDPRPFMNSGILPLFKHAADNGFPSDHTTMSALIAFVVLAFSRKIGAAMIVLACLIGAARVFAHVHSWIDIIGGLAVAGLAAGCTVLLTRAATDKMTIQKETT
jgi:undecaprenyl-diphosphatase